MASENIEKCINVKEHRHGTCLTIFKSAEKGCIACLNEIIRGGINVNQVDDGGETILHIAARYSRDEYIRKAVNLGSDVNARKQRVPQNYRYWESQPIHIAAMNIKLKTIATLCELGADINARDEEGQTPVLMMYNNMNIAEHYEELSNLGANFLAKDNDNANILHYLSQYDDASLVKKMIEIGANKDEKTINGYTPLHEAADNNSYKVIKELLELGADPCVTNNLGEHALDLLEVIVNDQEEENKEREETISLLKLYMEDIPVTKGVIPEGENDSIS